MRRNYFSIITIFSATVLLLIGSCNKDTVLKEGICEEQFESVIITKSGISDFKVIPSDVEWLIKTLYPDSGVFEIEPYPDDESPLMYVVNFDKGWRIVSGDKRTDPILALNDEGRMKLSELTNPGLLLWREEISESIEALDGIKEEYLKNLRMWKYHFSHENDIMTKSGNGRWYRELVDEFCSGRYVDIISPLLTTNWGQEYPWNLHAPLNYYSQPCYLGCAPVALSQILYYFHFHDTSPQGLYHSVSCVSNNYSWNYYTGSWEANVSFSRSDFSSPSNRWSQMPVDTSHAVDNLSNAKYVEDLVLDVGNRIGVIYADTGTSGTILGAYNALPFYNMTGTLSDNYNFNYIYNDLTNRKPVYIRGRNSEGLGHAWVIDGRRQDMITTRRIYVWHEAGPTWEGETYTTAEAQAMLGEDIDLNENVGYLETSEDLGPKYFHMNWGLDGRDNGYYVTDADWKQYNIDKKIIYNIHAIQ